MKSSGSDSNFNSEYSFNPNPNSNFFINLLKRKKTSTTNVNENNGPIPKWFDWNYYINTYEDLRNAGINDSEKAYDHWNLFGEKEGRDCMKDYKTFKKYPSLFNKYLLGLTNSESPMKYQVVSERNKSKRNICSVHCFDMKNFGRFFDEYISKLHMFFDFIITYVHDLNDIRDQYNFTFIKIENKGMDIGSKFVTVNYLKANNIDYSYVFFIHSKSNDLYRKKFIDSFISNLPEIIEILNEDIIGAIFNGETHMDEKWGRNRIYMNDIISYFNVDPNFFFFPAGNFFIINKHICESLFTDLKIYNILNYFNSFDYSWVKSYYNLIGDHEKVYSDYIANNLFGNNVETKMGHAGLADCMIEHVFERLMFLICNRDNQKFFICDKKKNKFISANSELTISVIACHSENSTKINTIVNNVNYLTQISDIIYIIDTDSFINNNLIQSLQEAYPDACINHILTDEKALQYINDNPDLSHMSIEEAKHHFKNNGYKESNRLHIFSSFIFVFYCKNFGYCYGKWMHFYDNIARETKYKNYILANDSFLITRPLDEFDCLIKENKYDLISLTASNEISYHYTDFLRNYNSESMNMYKNFLSTQLRLHTDFLDVIRHIELPSLNLFNNRTCLYDVEPNYYKNIHFDEDKLMHYLNELNYPIVKIKKIGTPSYDNYTLPSDFNPAEYIDANPDLKYVNDAQSHFLEKGINEKRRYKKNQRIRVYEPLKEYLLEYVSNNSHICKIDFENYTA